MRLKSSQSLWKDSDGAQKKPCGAKPFYIACKNKNGRANFRLDDSTESESQLNSYSKGHNIMEFLHLHFSQNCLHNNLLIAAQATIEVCIIILLLEVDFINLHDLEIHPWLVMWPWNIMVAAHHSHRRFGTSWKYRLQYCTFITTQILVY